MINTKISIIVPIFNEETHLKDCLDYIVNQTIQEIEIICIYNTFSKDKSSAILKEYNLIDNRIKIINTDDYQNFMKLGLENSSGRYIHFISCNNWIEEDLYEILYEKSELNNLDMLIFQETTYNLITNEELVDDNFNLFSKQEKIQDKIFNARNLENLMFLIQPSIHGILFKRKLFENIDFHEDKYDEELFFYKTILNSTNISFIPAKIYSNANELPKKSDNDYLNVISSTNEIIELFEEMNYYDTYKRNLLNYKCNLIWQNYKKITEKNKITMYNLIKTDFNNIYKNKYEFDEYERHLNEKNKILFDNIINTKTYDEFLMLIKFQNINKKYENLKKEKELYEIQNEKYKEQQDKQLNYDFTELSERYQEKQKQFMLLNKDFAELSEKYSNLEKNLLKLNSKIDLLEYKTNQIRKSIDKTNKSPIKLLFKH